MSSYLSKFIHKNTDAQEIGIYFHEIKSRICFLHTGTYVHVVKGNYGYHTGNRCVLKMYTVTVMKWPLPCPTVLCKGMNHFVRSGTEGINLSVTISAGSNKSYLASKAKFCYFDIQTQRIKISVNLMIALKSARQKCRSKLIHICDGIVGIK